MGNKNKNKNKNKNNKKNKNKNKNKQEEEEEEEQEQEQEDVVVDGDGDAGPSSSSFQCSYGDGAKITVAICSDGRCMTRAMLVASGQDGGARVDWKDGRNVETRQAIRGVRLAAADTLLQRYRRDVERAKAQAHAHFTRQFPDAIDAFFVSDDNAGMMYRGWC
jgi:hypothetical protein